MNKRNKFMLLASTLVFCLMLCIGYASLTDMLTINGSATLAPPKPDIYISDVTPTESAGVSLLGTTDTVFSAVVNGSGTATFTVEVTNSSAKTYIFERVIDGAEINIDGVYSGTDIKYSLAGLATLDEVGPGKRYPLPSLSQCQGE